MIFGETFHRGRIPISSFLWFIGGFSMGSWMTLFHQIQMERTLSDQGEIAPLLTLHRHPQPLLLLAVLVVSSPGNVDLRDTLRRSWIKMEPGGGDVAHFFAIGTLGLDNHALSQLEHEQLIHSDLLLMPSLRDSYHNLTFKVVQSLSMLSSLHPFRYVLKVDDDSFVRVDEIYTELVVREKDMHGEKMRKCFYWGFFDGRARVQKTGKWKESDYVLCDLYLPYALGGGYVLSKTCTDFIVSNQHFLKMFNNEDVTVGTWLAPLQVERRHDVRFDTEYESRGCNNAYLVQHKILPTEMIEKYRNLATTGKLCSKETKRRASYVYDWSVPPSQCCKRDSSMF